MTVATKDIPSSEQRNSTRNQYLATIIVNLTTILYGYASGWTSSSLLILESDELTPLVDGAMNQEQRSWVTSLFAISGVVGTICYYFIADFLGRKLPLWSLAIPHGISWILIEYGIYPWQLYLSRILAGLVSGGGFALVPIFISEISESHIRGRLGSLLMLSANSGFLFGFLAGYYLSYFEIPYFGIILSIVFLVSFTYFPETPSFLLRCKKEELAERSFRFYRNVKKGEPMPENIGKEWDELQKGLEEMMKSKSKIKNNFEYKDLFKTRAGRKALIIGIVFVFMHEFCGVFTMLNYTAKIFLESGSTISPKLSAIIVGLIQLIGTYFATFFVDRLGRKILLVLSSIGTAICLACLGAYSYAHSIGIDVKPYSWVSIASFSGMMFLAAVGLIPLMFVVIAEVMPEKVRSIGCTICFCLSWVLAFLMVKFFESVIDQIGLFGCMFLFSICTVFGAIFIIIFIPETKGKTYAEIAAILDR
ncbi:facilitated trehalose transporter Tret1-like isoform X2 [Sitodiplosis mosellana]|uniref:facilitated trehalose transporter Tret1-like isoform X2 n=1 Tax=Sitodiplosis mosellana TaxID=263140 RepID=UPI0024442F03|nr:facilitated trehalose transporter Tret1-like isoform X2 [Sitodiplosis mosellana]